MSFTPQNSTILTVRKYTRDLINSFDTLIIPLTLKTVLEGRTNSYRDDDSTNRIVIDSLAPASIYSTSQYYNDVSEKQVAVVQYQQTLTANFYGANGYILAGLFIGGLQLQNAWDIAKTYNLSIFSVSSMQDLTFLQDKQDLPRYEITFNVITRFENSIDLVPIENVEITLETN